MLYDSRNRPIQLGRHLGHGGEGDVYEVVRNKRVAKILHAPGRTAERETKLRLMVAHVPRDPTASLRHITLCWPSDLLFEAGHRFAGFLMPLVDTTRCPSLIRFMFPQFYPAVFHWGNQIEIAMNLAAGLAAIHEKGYVFGDLNEKNVHVTPSCLVTFVDCDSMQVRDPASGRVLRCPVGMPGYLAPELQNIDLATVDRSQGSDSFAFAVMVCQLLLAGTHPFAGGRGQTREDNIANNDSFLLGGAPPRTAPSPALLPPALLALLVRCFREGHRNPQARPAIHEFAQVLAATSRQLATCKQVPKRHVYSRHLAECPWCQHQARFGFDPYSLQTGQAPGQHRKVSVGSTPSPPPLPLSTGRKARPFLRWLAAAMFLMLAVLIVYGGLHNPRTSPLVSAENPEPAPVAVPAPVPRLPATAPAQPTTEQPGTAELETAREELPKLEEAKPREQEIADLQAQLKAARAKGRYDDERELALRLLALDPEDALAQSVRTAARERTLGRSRLAEELENEEGVRRVWDQYERDWPGDEAGRQERTATLERLSQRAQEREQRATEREHAQQAARDEVRRGSLREAAIQELELRTIPPLRFEMGCTTGDDDCEAREKPAHRARLTHSFALAAYETTNGLYRKCVEAGACAPPSKRADFDDPEKERHPVTWVSWEDAQSFCRWIGGRLPTEAEWEMAARGLLVGARYPTGNDLGHEDANFAGIAGRDRWEGTAPVGSFPPNRLKLYDMAGNVREWVADSINTYPQDEIADPLREPDPRLRIVRGGSWDQPKEKLRVSTREWAAPATAHSASIGFRCAR